MSYVYCIPDEANYVYRIGPITKGCPASKVRVESIGVDPVGGDPNNENRVIEGKKYSSAVLCETGDIFCIPFKALRVLCISAERTSSGIKTGVDLVCEVGVDVLDIEYCGAVVIHPWVRRCGALKVVEPPPMMHRGSPYSLKPSAAGHQPPAL